MARRSAAVFTGVLVVALAACSSKREPRGDVGQEPQPQPQATASASKGPMNTGIQVHGHWKVEVLSPDGKQVIETREFENALTAGGADLLASLLLGTHEPRPNLNRIDGFDGTTFLVAAGTGSAPVSLVTTAITSGIRLSGADTAVASGSINRVETKLGRCPIAPGCSGMTVQTIGFTEATLAGPIPVTMGQIVQFTVDITFQ